MAERKPAADRTANVETTGKRDPTAEPAGPPKLPPEQLRTEQRRTLDAPKRRYGIGAKALFATMDGIYGRQGSLRKFKVLEIVARCPYQAWENVAYVALTHTFSDPKFARRIYDRVRESREQQDNEQWHLLIIEELLTESRERQGFIRFWLVPQVLAFIYYHLSWLLFVIRPTLSYRLNADFEDHAEHEYAVFVENNPELADRPYQGLFADEYGRFDSIADLFRQIGHDERVHKEESLAKMAAPPLPLNADAFLVLLDLLAGEVLDVLRVADLVEEQLQLGDVARGTASPAPDVTVYC